MHNRDAEIGRAQQFNQRQKKRFARGKEIALFCPFRHLFSSTYNTAILLRTANRLMKEMPKIFLKVRCGCLRLLFFTAIAVGLAHPRALAQAILRFL